MNFHPIFVHFPIALLTLYSLFELVRFRQVMRQQYWFYIKAILVIVGTAFTIPSVIAGKIIEGNFLEQQALVETHSHFAIYTTVVFGIIATIYFLSWLGKHIKIFEFEDIFFKWWILVPMAIIGLVLITITGSLGGVIALGLGTDPVADFVYKLFFK